VAAFLQQDVLLAGVGVAAGVGFFLRGFGLWRRKRLIENTPRSKVRSLALGRVELHGKALAGAELEAPVSGLPCVYFAFRIEEERGSGKNRRWHLLLAGDSAEQPFFLEDETGRIRVDPAGADVEVPDHVRSLGSGPDARVEALLLSKGISFGGFFGTVRRVRASEKRILPGDPLFVLGVAQERPGLARERRETATGRLRALKADPAALAAADRDGDGRISAEEWEAVRREAVREAELAPAADAVVVARAPRGEAPFVISNHREEKLLRRLGLRAWGRIFGGAALALGCLAWLFARFGMGGTSP
jgi:hypothetical protein